MKKILVFSIMFLTTLASMALDNDSSYQFTVIKKNPITSIKNQGNSGTCWSFSGVGFLESELLRMGKGEYDLSEMYIVRRNYADQAQKYVRLSGKLNFSQGGSFADVIETINEYGVLPDAEMNGFNYGETSHKHSEMEAILSGYVKAVVENRNKKLSTAWLKGFNGVLDAYLGSVPQSFEYKGKSYTPQSFASSLGLNSDNYISITSFTHHPFYTSFPIEVADNWRWASSLNLPLDEMMKTIDNAIMSGFTIAWASDVSEVGFTRNGIAVIPDLESSDNIGSDQAHWLGLNQLQQNTHIKNKIEAGPVKEINVNQEMRQIAYDNYETTDDHGMQIFGIVKDQKGTKYYLVKNSWGDAGKYKGIWYVSETFVRYKTLSMIVHKDALSKDILNKIK